MLRRHPVLLAYAIAGLAWVGLAYGALADEAVMSRAIEAGSLHDGPLDMVAYFRPAGDGTLVVTATFAERDTPDAHPMRVVMALAEGDDVAFAMPGFEGALYRFSRAGDAVSVSVRDVGTGRRAVAGL